MAVCMSVWMLWLCLLLTEAHLSSRVRCLCWEIWRICLSICLSVCLFTFDLILPYLILYYLTLSYLIQPFRPSIVRSCVRMGSLNTCTPPISYIILSYPISSYHILPYLIYSFRPRPVRISVRMGSHLYSQPMCVYILSYLSHLNLSYIILP